MKKPLFQITLASFIFTLCSFQSSTFTLQEVVQEVFDTEAFTIHFETDKTGKLLPITLISNEFVTSQMDVMVEGQPVSIQSKLKENNKVEGVVLELTALKVKGKKSFLTFKYEEKTIKVRLKREGDQWTAKTVSVKWKNGIDVKIVATTEKHF